MPIAMAFNRGLRSRAGEQAGGQRAGAPWPAAEMSHRPGQESLPSARCCSSSSRVLGQNTQTWAARCQSPARRSRLGSCALTRGRMRSLPEQAPGGHRRTVPVHSAAGLCIAGGLMVVRSEHVKQLLVVLRRVHAVRLGVIAHRYTVPRLSALLLCRQHHGTEHTAGR